MLHEKNIELYTKHGVYSEAEIKAHYEIKNEKYCKYLNIEVLVPVNDSFKSNSKYVYKPYFRIENAVKLRHYGKYSGLKNSKTLILNYLEENKLTPITNVYYRIVDNDLSSGIIDLYIGINSNIL